MIAPALAIALCALGEAAAARPARPSKEPPPSAGAKASAQPSNPVTVIREELTPDRGTVHPEYAACPASIALDALDPETLVTQVRQRCRNLRVPANATPTEITPDDVLVAICVREVTAIAPAQCGMKVAAVVPTSDGASTSVPLTPQGALSVALRASKVEALSELESGAPFSLAITTQTASTSGLDLRTARSPLVFHRDFVAYGKGRWFWLPTPMLTSDLTSKAGGYRLGITPIAAAVGTRWYPTTTRDYLGASLFVGWNLLVPNDTQSLTNGTSVRINYKAMGGGVLFDLAGFVGVGVGVGHTFTMDDRTDFRTWLYVGPRTLKFLGDL